MPWYECKDCLINGASDFCTCEEEEMTTQKDMPEVAEYLQNEADQIFKAAEHPEMPLEIRAALIAKGNMLDRSAKYISTVTAKLEAAEKYIKALEKIQTISAHMQSKRSSDINRIASEALHEYLQAKDAK